MPNDFDRRVYNGRGSFWILEKIKSAEVYANNENNYHSLLVNNSRGTQKKQFLFEIMSRA